MENKPEEFFSLRQCANYGKVTRQAIYVAIKLGKLKATKVKKQWRITRKDYDHYRLNKYSRDDKKIGDEYVYDMAKGHYSVTQIVKIISESTGKKFDANRLYYLIKTGNVRSFRKGHSIIVEKKHAEQLLENLLNGKKTSKCG